jgi:hypothetical protein
MLSNVTLALAHSHAAAPFNANFYIAAATVIPVLFVAIAVQGTLYEALLKTTSLAGWRLIRTYLRLGDIPPGRVAGVAREIAFVVGVIMAPLIFVPALLAVLSPAAFAVAILVSGFSGEAETLLALYRERAGGGIPGHVLAATLILTAAVAAAPAVRLIRYTFWPPGSAQASDQTARAVLQPARRRTAVNGQAQLRLPTPPKWAKRAQP